MGVTEFKTSPRHLNFLKQLKKKTEMMLLLRFLFLDTPGHLTSALQYSNSSKNSYFISGFGAGNKMIDLRGLRLHIGIAQVVMNQNKL